MHNHQRTAKRNASYLSYLAFETPMICGCSVALFSSVMGRVSSIGYHFSASSASYDMLHAMTTKPRRVQGACSVIEALLELYHALWNHSVHNYIRGR